MTQSSPPESPLAARFRQRLAEGRARSEARSARHAPTLEQDTPPPAPTIQYDWSPYASAIPEPIVNYERSELELAIDKTLEGLDVLTSYQRYCRKMNPVCPPGKREGIMISCPKPSHPDKNPSAWINLDLNTWFCGGCQEGGDQFDIAAYHFGYDSNSYKAGANWGIFRKTLAEDLGLVVEKVPGFGTVVYRADEDSDPDLITVSLRPTSPEETSGDHVRLEPEHKKEILPEDIYVRSLDWEPLVPENTFLSDFMHAVTIDDVPEEFHFWHAMMALGLVVGRDARLTDNPEVYPNIFVCLLGTTGSGKSKSKRYITQVIHEAAPFDPNEAHPRGVKIIPTPASAEALIKAFQKDIQVPGPGGRLVKSHAPVRGFVEFTEFAQLTSRMARTGNTLAPTLIDFYDCTPSVSSIAAGRDGERFALEPLASVLTTVQPEILNDLFSDADEASGFLNRWIFVTGQRKKKQIFNRTVINLGDAVVKLRKIHTWSNSQPRILWSPEAESLFEKAWHDYIQQDVLGNPMALARIDLVLKKLGLLFAINEMSNTVTAEMFERVLQIYPYMKGTVEFKSTSMIGSGEAAVDDALVEALRKCGPGPHTGRDIKRKVVRKYRDLSQEKVNRYLVALSDAGVIHKIAVIPGSKGGRPTFKYEYQG